MRPNNTTHPLIEKPNFFTCEAPWKWAIVAWPDAFEYAKYLRLNSMFGIFAPTGIRGIRLALADKTFNDHLAQNFAVVH